MANVVQLHGSLMNRSISEQEFEEIRSAATSSDKNKDISSIWGHIADWFCGTKKEEAKKLLFQILQSNGDSVALNKLKDMASDPYKDCFKCVENEQTDVDKHFGVKRASCGIYDINDLDKPLYTWSESREA